MVFVPERVWVDRGRYLEAEQNFLSGKGKKARDGSVLTKQSTSTTTTTTTTSSETINQHQENPLTNDIHRVRQFIQKSLRSPLTLSEEYKKKGERLYPVTENAFIELLARVSCLEREKASMTGVIDDLLKRMEVLEIRCIDNPTEAECRKKIDAGLAKRPPTMFIPMPRDPPIEIPKHLLPKYSDDEDDDDMGLFGDDDKAPKKPAPAPVPVKTEKKKKEVIAKSSVVLDIKPWDDETDMVAMEKCVRSIEKDGLLWGTSKLVPVAYNVKKLQIVCVVEDEKVGIEELSEQIEGFEDYVQSVDVAAFNKI